ncbi:MAG TPA: exopolysaccharide Pel transporter PelG [Thermoanaerobaculia bacterium]|nr:exopolysaccharide Pel transporter PelG [Thermoanaerobaculia bacterium]
MSSPIDTERSDLTSRPSAVGPQPFQDLIDLIGTPKDQWEIAAQLEVLGLRDADARSDYGARDLFDLARQIYGWFIEGRFRSEIEREDPEPRVSPIVRFLRNYATGLTFSLPMALQAAVMLTWGYGVWGAIDMDLRTGTAIALGFIASYIVTGGFMQTIVRRGLFYVYQQEAWLARWTALRSWSLALRVVLGLLVPALLLNALFRALPWSIVLTAAAYYVALSILWLNWALIYLVRKTWLFLLTTAVALATVLIAAKLFGASPPAANAVGLIVADVLSFSLAFYHLNRLTNARKVVNPPRLTILVYSTSRFFLYGMLYNTFLFADRILAWTSSTGREDFPPYGFWLNVRYELGMDLALIVVMLLSGVVEHATQRFSERLIPNEKRTRSVDAATFMTLSRKEHRQRVLTLAGAACIAVFVAILVTMTLRGATTLPIYNALMATTTMRVFIVATIAYVIFMFALQNVLMLLTLSRVELVARAIGIALAVNLGVGFICSRAIHYSAAAFGLLAGAAALAFLTARAMRQVLSELDYHYYAAY